MALASAVANVPHPIAPLVQVLSKSGLVFACKEGQCGTCEVKLDGKVVRACVTKLPQKSAVNIDVTQNKLLKSRQNSNF